MAAVGAVATVLPTIASSPAFADSGSPGCLYTYTTDATRTITLSRPSNGNGRFQIATTAPGGSCLCTGIGTLTTSYSYFGSLTGNSTVTASSSGWVVATSFDSGTLAIGGGNSAFSYSIEVGVRIQCPGRRAATYLCRFVSVAAITTSDPQIVGPTTLAATSATNLPTC